MSLNKKLEIKSSKLLKVPIKQHQKKQSTTYTSTNLKQKINTVSNEIQQLLFKQNHTVITDDSLVTSKFQHVSSQIIELLLNQPYLNYLQKRLIENYLINKQTLLKKRKQKPLKLKQLSQIKKKKKTDNNTKEQINITKKISQMLHSNSNCRNFIDNYQAVSDQQIDKINNYEVIESNQLQGSTNQVLYDLQYINSDSSLQNILQNTDTQEQAKQNTNDTSYIVRQETHIQEQTSQLKSKRKLKEIQRKISLKQIQDFTDVSPFQLEDFFKLIQPRTQLF